MTKISLISTRCPRGRHTQKGQLHCSVRVSHVPGLGHLFLGVKEEEEGVPGAEGPEIAKECAC